MLKLTNKSGSVTVINPDHIIAIVTNGELTCIDTPRISYQVTETVTEVINLLVMSGKGLYSWTQPEPVKDIKSSQTNSKDKSPAPSTSKSKLSKTKRRQ